MRIKLSGVKNARDFSEYGCEKYIRSANLHKLTEKDAAMLSDKYELKTVIDLRTTQEFNEKPDAEIPGVKYIHIPIFEDAVPGVSHERSNDEILSKMPDMARFYDALVTEEKYVSQLKKAMDVINDPEREGTVLWHCTEGKDRCGILSALFLLSHGVQPQEVMKDYLKTNRVNTKKAWKYYFLILLSGRGRALAAKVRDAFLAKRSYLEPVMDKLTALSEEYK